MGIIMDILGKFERAYSRSNAKRFEAFLRRKGIKIGKNIYWGTPRTITIYTTRPCLLEIGDNVRLDSGLTILTHDFATYVFRLVYKDFVSATAKVKIGSNVYFGRNCTVLKGVSIGDNCIIGLGSLITKDIPPNSVVAGVPAKVISTLDDYYKKRKLESVDEAKAYAREIKKYYNKIPVMEDFKEEFPLFWSPEMSTSEEFKKMVHFQLDSAYDEFVKKNKPLYPSFEAFLDDCNL
jgi:acetyltransferase-like isoleucine patch superfamily enzyme